MKVGERTIRVQAIHKIQSNNTKETKSINLAKAWSEHTVKSSKPSPLPCIAH